MKMISWNVNGIRAAWSHGLSSFITECGADIYAFQETKTDHSVVTAEVEGYHAYWSCCKRSGYSGTLVLAREEPRNVRCDIGDPSFDTEGRIITLEYDRYYFVNCYVPNSQRTSQRYDYRTEWDELLLKFLLRLQRQKPVILCGDFNVAISDQDIYEQSAWIERNAQGFLSTERESLLKLTENGFVDTYRLLHPQETGKFTWWSNRLNKRQQNYGWRLDYFFVSQSLCPAVQESAMLTEVHGSDHCPIVLETDPLSETESAELQPGLQRLHYTYTQLLEMEKQRALFDHLRYGDMTELWEGVDWDAAEQHLRQMQMALAKSAYTRDWELIQKWQKRIVRSIDAKLLAVRHVCSTGGGSGVDCIQWKTPPEKMTAALSLTSKNYHALPSRLLLIRSKSGRQRRIHVETYFDRAMQTLYAYALDPVAESWGDKKSFAYRKGRSFFDMNEHIISAFSGINAPEWVVRADVHKCYEHISHQWILRHIPMDPHVLREFLEAGYVFASELFPSSVGVGIGCALSPILANMALDGLQNFIYAQLHPNGGEIDYANGNLIRYADDIIVAARDRETAEKILRVIRQFLEERGLELSSEKSRIFHISEEFTCMSRTYAKRGTQLYARPSDQSVERFMKSLEETIEDHTGSQKDLIQKMNRKIDGWATYHKVSEASDAFRFLDVFIAGKLLEKCETIHPKWTREKILERYWYVDAEGRHHYALANKKEIRVKSLADTLFVTYFPVRLGANPYIDTEYIERRSKERSILNVTGVYRAIWNRQEGRCYYCGRRILRDDEKTLIDLPGDEARFIARKAYVHTRCLDGSIEYIDTDTVPSSLNDVMELLEKLDANRRPHSQKFFALSSFFQNCDKPSVSLTFRQIETIMGAPLGATALRREFWYRTGFQNISQCWLNHGYAIQSLHLEGSRHVVFHLTAEHKNTASIDLPAVLKYQRVPKEAKYELENYCQYIIKKYGLS